LNKFWSLKRHFDRQTIPRYVGTELLNKAIQLKLQLLKTGRIESANLRSEMSGENLTKISAKFETL
jgi:hypothetical protein